MTLRKTNGKDLCLNLSLFELGGQEVFEPLQIVVTSTSVREEQHVEFVSSFTLSYFFHGDIEADIKISATRVKIFVDELFILLLGVY